MSFETELITIRSHNLGSASPESQCRPYTLPGDITANVSGHGVQVATPPSRPVTEPLVARWWHAGRHCLLLAFSCQQRCRTSVACCEWAAFRTILQFCGKMTAWCLSSMLPRVGCNFGGEHVFPGLQACYPSPETYKGKEALLSKQTQKRTKRWRYSNTVFVC